MVFFSVVVPVYNVEKYLCRCVDSLISQNYRDCEVILVDDGSTDGSAEICDQLASQYANIRVCHKANGGLASARNYGMAQAQGTYLLFVDSDDYVLPDYFAVLDRHLRRSQPDILKFAYRCQYTAGKPENNRDSIPCFPQGVYERPGIEEVILPDCIGQARLFDYSRSAMMSACTHAYSAEFLRRNQIRFVSEKEILNEDYLFNYHAALCARKMEVIHNVLYYYDYREGSTSKRYIQDMLRRKKQLLATYRDLLHRYGCYEQYETRYDSCCAESFYACLTNECGTWSDRSTAISNVRTILRDPECVAALRRCNHSGLGLKGTAIYWLMRLKMATAFYVLYRGLKAAAGKKK